MECCQTTAMALNSTPAIASQIRRADLISGYNNHTASNKKPENNSALSPNCAFQNNSV